MFIAEFNTSDMQFGYNKGHSTTLCTLVFKEVISHDIIMGAVGMLSYLMLLKRLIVYIMAIVDVGSGWMSCLQYTTP